MKTRYLAGAGALLTMVALALFSRVSLGDGETNPLLEWKFDLTQVSNKILLPAAGKWRLTIQGEPLWDQETNSAHFSGGADQAVIQLAKGEVGPRLGPNAVSLEAWVRLDCGARKGGLIGQVDDNRYGGQGVSLGYDEDRFRFGVASEGARKGDGVLTWIRSRSTIQPGKWTHLFATYDGVTMRLYVNGQEEAQSTAQNGPIIYGTAPFVVGGYVDDDERVAMVGSLHSVAAFPKALDPATIQSRFEQNKALSGIPPTKTLPYFLVAPYLQYPTTESIRVGFELSKPGKGLVEFGETEPLTNRVETPLATMHHATLSGLKPSTSYFYRVTAETGAGQKLVGPLLSFKTAPGSSESFNFAVFGDSQKNRRVTGQVATRAYENRPAFLLHLGDVVDDGTDKSQWLNDLFRPCQELFGRVAVMPTIGNHEKNHAFYYQYFNLPEPEYHYKFSWGDADFFAIDSNKPLVPGEGQMAWLEKELQGSKAKWKFCFHHHPCYSSDSDDYGDTFGGKKSVFGTDKMFMLASLYEKYGVDVVLNGHVHAYERTFPIRKNKVEDAGVVYLTSGGFGAGLENFSPTPTYFKAANRIDYHMVLFSVHDNTLELRAFDKDGQLFDTWKKTK